MAFRGGDPCLSTKSARRTAGGGSEVLYFHLRENISPCSQRKPVPEVVQFPSKVELGDDQGTPVELLTVAFGGCAPCSSTKSARRTAGRGSEVLYFHLRENQWTR